jgi:hypothetical protein
MTCFIAWAILLWVGVSGLFWWLEDTGRWPVGHR